MGFRDFLRSKPAQVATVCLLVAGVLLTIILIPLSLARIEYYEYGLKLRSTTGSVDISKVYENGRYFIGPTYDFLHYQSDAHHEQYTELGVFSSGGSNASIGLEFKIDVDFTFLLNEDEVGQLHTELASSYENVVNSRAKDAIKNEAIFVSFTEYFQDRESVEKRFRDAVQKRWNSQPSVHCTLDQFHLGRIQIPESVAQKQLEARLQNERNDKEKSFQQAQIEREQTAVEVNSILLEKEKILRTTNAEADLIRARATAEAEQLTAEAQINGSRLLFQAAGITGQEHVTAFTYIRTLANKRDLDLDVSYLSSENVLRTKAT